MLAAGTIRQRSIWRGVLEGFKTIFGQRTGRRTKVSSNQTENKWTLLEISKKYFDQLLKLSRDPGTAMVA
jgi:hypothetical protein